MGDDRDRLAGLDDAPWPRIMHFYGRASDVPLAIRALGGPGRESAIRHLRRCLEHQDGVIQATPFAVRFILRIREKDPEGVREIIEPIAAAARFTLANFAGPLPDADWESLLNEDGLWPEFTSAQDDEILWEEWNPAPAEWIGWSILTLREIAQVTSPSGS
jgi:hypothetical protein